MKPRKDAPWVECVCAYRPCSKPFKTQNPEQQYCSKPCCNKQHLDNQKILRRGGTVEKLPSHKTNTNPITYTTLVMIVQAHDKGESLSELAKITFRDERYLKAVLAKMIRTGKYDAIKKTFAETAIREKSSLWGSYRTVFVPTGAHLSL